MPKLKTAKGVKDRLKVTGTGKIRTYRRAGRGHLLAGKASKRMRRLRGPSVLTAGDTRQVRPLIPYA